MMPSKHNKPTSWEISNIPQLTDQVAIVTGGNRGIGYQVCLELARKGAKVYLACRSEERARSAIASLLQEVPGGQFHYIHFDLTRLRTCKEAAETFLQRESRLDILVNHATVKSTSPYTLSEDGIEIQACNAVGHFSLTDRLVPLMKTTAQGVGRRHVRIVNMTSVIHKLNSEPDFSNLNGVNQRRCSSLERHANSMLSIVIFNQELQKRLQGTGIVCVAVNPGLRVERLLQNDGNLCGMALLLFHDKGPGLLFGEAKNAAFTPLYAATAWEVEHKQLGGRYLVPPGKPATPHPNARDATGVVGLQLWNTMVNLVYHPHRLERVPSRSCRGASFHVQPVRNNNAYAW